MKKYKILGVLPARLNSKRLPRKMLADICGKPLIQHTWEHASKSKYLDALVIATDSKEIATVARNFGANVIMTSSKHNTGSDRVAEAARKFKKFKPDLVINIQGDEPLLPGKAIDQLIKAMLKDKNADMGTIAIPCNNLETLNDPDTVKTIINKKGDAIFFSRSVLPFSRTPYSNYYSKLGLYAFKYEFLQKFVKMKQTPLEIAESLEQLRAIENGYKIKAPIGRYSRQEVNNAKQLDEVRKIYAIKNRL